MSASAGRCVLIVSHTGRKDAVTSAREVAAKLNAAGVGVRTLESEAPDLDFAGIGVDANVVASDAQAAKDAEVVFVLGGGGALFRAARDAPPAGGAGARPH